MSISVVESNNFILGKNIDLFSKLLGSTNNNGSYCQSNIEIAKSLLPKVIYWVNIINFKQKYLWKMLFLFEIILTTLF